MPLSQLTRINDAVNRQIVLDGHVADDGKHSDTRVDRREKADDVDN